MSIDINSGYNPLFVCQNMLYIYKYGKEKAINGREWRIRTQPRTGG